MSFAWHIKISFLLLHQYVLPYYTAFTLFFQMRILGISSVTCFFFFVCSQNSFNPFCSTYFMTSCSYIWFPDSFISLLSMLKRHVVCLYSRSVGGKTISTDEKDLISAQREKRPAPQPPGRSQAESWGEQDVSTRHLAQINKQGNDKDVKTDSVLPQCSVKMIAPLSQPLTDTKNTQSLEQTSTTKGAASARLHSKRPAPSRPRSVEESSEPKTALSSNDNISQRGVSETKQVPVVYGLNPFEDDEDELTAQDDTTAPIDAIQWPPAVSQDAASQAKLKSSKMAHAPAPPAKKAPTSSTLIHQNTDGDHVTDETAQKTSLKEPKLVRAQSTGEEAGVKKEVPPVPSRR